MVYSHDTARIVQWMLKLGSPEIRTQVINELIKHVPKMLLSKYACLCVKNMLKEGNKDQRKTIIDSLKGKIYTYTMYSVSIPFKIYFIELMFIKKYVNLFSLLQRLWI